MRYYPASCWDCWRAWMFLVPSGGYLALLNGLSLLFLQLLHDLLPYGDELLLFQLEFLDALQGNHGALNRLYQLGPHCQPEG